MTCDWCNRTATRHLVVRGTAYGEFAGVVKHFACPEHIAQLAALQASAIRSEPPIPQGVEQRLFET